MPKVELYKTRLCRQHETSSEVATCKTLICNSIVVILVAIYHSPKEVDTPGPWEATFDSKSASYIAKS